MNPATNKIIRPYLRVAIILTLVNLAILGIRNLYVGEHVFNFLESNLFIGSFPTIIIAWLIDLNHKKMGRLLFWFAVALWVLFYPNAPYMISDLIHNSESSSGPKDPLIVYDTLIIFSIAMLSVFIGFLSLKVIFRIFIEKYGRRFARAFITFTLVLSCLGFYMGRTLPSHMPKVGNGYLYSWEIFLEPLEIIKIVWHALYPVQDNIPAYLMMALFGAVQYMLLIMFKDVNDVENITNIS